MNVRRGNTILRTSKLSKNYSNLPMYVCVVCKIHVPLQNAHSKKNARTNSKHIQSIPTKFEVKVSQGTQTASEIQNQKPLPPIQTCVFFLRKFNFHWFTSDVIHSYVIPPSPFPLPIHTVCVSVTQSHPNLFEWTVRMDQTMGHFCVGRIKMFPQIKQTIFTIHPVAK